MSHFQIDIIPEFEILTYERSILFRTTSCSHRILFTPFLRLSGALVRYTDTLCHGFPASPSSTRPAETKLETKYKIQQSGAFNQHLLTINKIAIILKPQLVPDLPTGDALQPDQGHELLVVFW